MAFKRSAKKLMITDDEYYERLDRIGKRAVAGIEGECRVRFSAYKFQDGEPVDNIDEVAITGRVRSDSVELEGIYPDLPRYVGDVMQDPTWKDVTAEANRMLIALNFGDSVFLESISEIGPDSGDSSVTRISLWFGS